MFPESSDAQATFWLTPRQVADAASWRRVARERLCAIAAAGVPGRVNRPLLSALGEERLLGRLFPRAHGGLAPSQVSALELCLLREALAQECTEAETALALQGLGGHPIVSAGAPAVIARYVPAIARGEAVAAFALTEPEAGSDVAAVATRAEQHADGWVISGAKVFISNAPEADVYVVFALTTEEAGTKGISAFVVPGDAAGLSGEPQDLLAPHAIGRLTFDRVRVPRENLLGSEGSGFALAMQTLDLFRPSVGAFAVGMAQAALDATIAHAGQRRQFGRALHEHQAVAHQLADMATWIEAARLLVYRAAAARDAGATRNTKLAAMAKLFATETAQRVVDAAVQLHGARALERGHLLEHLYREVRAPRIYEGTSEIQRAIIARELYR